MGRIPYLDLLPPVAIGGVVYGHWLLTDIIYSAGWFSGLDALGYIAWGRWVTWAFQVMPVFFLVGGYANALSWTEHQAQGERWTWWIQRRVMRLWWPTAVYLGVSALSVVIAGAAGLARADIALAGRLVTLQLWFLPMYMALIALTRMMLAAHRRWGLAVPASMAAAAAFVARPRPFRTCGCSDTLTTCWCGALSTSGASLGGTASSHVSAGAHTPWPPSAPPCWPGW
jgi:surface polysaccharide O-acyltransferase-like enzyme